MTGTLRRADSLIALSRVHIARGIAHALLREFPEARLEGKRAGRLIFEAVAELRAT